MLVHALQCEDVAFDVGLDHRPVNEASPPGLIANEWRSARIAAEVHEPVQIEVERRRHLGEGPVLDIDDLVATGKALGQPALHQERCRAEQYDMKREAFKPIGIPEPLHGLRPVRDLLNLVEYQDRAPLRSLRFQAGRLPLTDDPARVPPVNRREGSLHFELSRMPLEVRGFRHRGWIGGVYGDIAERPPKGSQDLLDQRSLACLTWPGHDVEPTWLFAQPLQKGLRVWAFVAVHKGKLHY